MATRLWSQSQLSTGEGVSHPAHLNVQSQGHIERETIHTNSAQPTLRLWYETNREREHENSRQKVQLLCYKGKYSNYFCHHGVFVLLLMLTDIYKSCQFLTAGHFQNFIRLVNSTWVTRLTGKVFNISHFQTAADIKHQSL